MNCHYLKYFMLVYERHHVGKQPKHFFKNRFINEHSCVSYCLRVKYFTLMTCAMDEINQKNVSLNLMGCFVAGGRTFKVSITLRG
jgi:hypothetical protein